MPPSAGCPPTSPHCSPTGRSCSAMTCTAASPSANSSPASARTSYSSVSPAATRPDTSSYPTAASGPPAGSAPATATSRSSSIATSGATTCRCAGDEALRGTCIDFEIRRNVERTYHNSFFTRLEISADNVAEIARAGRARWKIENEHFNCMARYGYNLKHNFGHGRTGLAASRGFRSDRSVS